MDNIALYMKKRRQTVLLFALGLALLLLFMVWGVGVGAMSISLGEAMDILARKVLNRPLDHVKANVVAVVLDIRLPRILCATLVGAGLAASGVIFQALLNNPLADPYTLGISTGAAFGASLAILAGILYAIALPTTPFAFLFAILTLALVLIIAEKSGGFSSGSLVIAGIIVSAILSSAISFIRMLAGENVGAIVHWMMGSLTGTHYAQVLLLTAIIAPCTVVACFFLDDLNVMMTGDRTAQSLGVRVKRTRVFYLLLGALMTAACVAVGGIIGFVGLVVPHLLRRVVGADNRALFPLSAVYGAVILVLADNVTRLIGSGEIPVGVLTTLIGGPFFIYVYTRRPNGRAIDAMHAAD